MSESNHTPGPWGFGRTSDDQRLILGDGGEGRYVCHVQIHQMPRYMGTHDEPEREANAALIARAPDLLREVEELRAKLARYESTAPIVIDDSHLSDGDLRRLKEVLGGSMVAAGRVEIVTTHPELAALRAQNAELLGLLERVKDEKGFTCDCGISEEVFDAADATIAKAKGGAA